MLELLKGTLEPPRFSSPGFTRKLGLALPGLPMLGVIVAWLALFVAVSLAAFVLFASDALANGGLGKANKNWTGVYIGGAVSVDTTDLTLNGQVTFEPSDYAWDVVIGYDHQLPNSPIVLGVRGMYGDSNASTSIESLSFTVEQFWCVDGRGGVSLFDDGLLLYVGGGYCDQETSASSGEESVALDFNGGRLFAGAEALLTDYVSLTAEAQAFYPDDLVVDDLALVAFEGYRGRVGLNIRFGGVGLSGSN